MAASPAASSTPLSQVLANADVPTNTRSVVIVSGLFFLWGFITCLNDLLIPKFKADFALTQFQANLGQSAFFGAYFLVSLLYFAVSVAFGDPINRLGYRNGICAGLLTAAAGCGLFYPAAVAHSYPLFLGALLVLGGGLTLIQIAANPYVAILGPARAAPARLNLSQGVNSLGYVVAPLLGGFFLFGSEVYSTTGAKGVAAVRTPYLGLAAAFFVLAFTFRFIRLPDYTNTEKVSRGETPFRFPHFTRGWFAIFCYVGAEVTIGSILINYLGDSSVLGMPAHEADKFLSFYWGGLMIGRLMGAVALGESAPARKHLLMAILGLASVLVIYANATFKQRLTTGELLSATTVWPFLLPVLLSYVGLLLGRGQAGRMIGLFGLVAILLTVLSISTHGAWALWSIVAIGLFDSVMWSNIFTLSIRGLGEATSQASSLLVMMIVGGALLPALQGALMDFVGVRASLSIVLLAYLYMVYFGLVGSRLKHTGIAA